MPGGSDVGKRDSVAGGEREHVAECEAQSGDIRTGGGSRRLPLRENPDPDARHLIHAGEPRFAQTGEPRGTGDVEGIAIEE